MLKDRYNSYHVCSIHHVVGPAHRSAGIFTTTLKSGHGLFHLAEKGKGSVAKVTGVPKSPQQVRRNKSIKEANYT